MYTPISAVDSVSDKNSWVNYALYIGPDGPGRLVQHANRQCFTRIKNPRLYPLRARTDSSAEPLNGTPDTGRNGLSQQGRIHTFWDFLILRRGCVRNIHVLTVTVARTYRTSCRKFPIKSEHRAFDIWCPTCFCPASLAPPCFTT